MTGEPGAELSLRERKKNQTRGSLHHVALRRVTEEGPDAVTVEDTCAEVGVSPQTFFNYYPSKIAAALDMPIWRLTRRSGSASRPAGDCSSPTVRLGGAHDAPPE